MEVVLLFVASGVILFLGVLVVYALVAPASKAKQPIAPHVLVGRTCMYCSSTHTHKVGQEPRYDHHGFAMVSAYECDRCGLPFWLVDRSPEQQRSH